MLAFYGKEKAPSLDHPELVGYHMTPLLKFFGAMTCWDISGEACRSYAAKRMAGELGRAVKSGTARRELVTLNAALQFAYTERKLSQPVPLTYPEAAPRRTRWLTRSEAAALLAGALGITVLAYDIKSRKPVKWGRLQQPSYHVARFILIGLYTGTRHEANLNMRWGVNSKGGWFDLDHGVMYRRGEGEADSNKRRVPAPIPDNLVPHLKRWKRITTVGPVEYAGRLILKERKGWDRATELAGLDSSVTPHVLKHTCITWMLQNRVPIWEVAGFVGTSEKVIRDTYGHHSPDHLNAARTAFSGRSLGRRK
ncbi:site-specific integrase [Bradyrhizobium ivorense]|uniref:site-specific integrase n=1 Tax=Bradyrhizobium ivorense TaxID=2511166 RepID=UPI0027E2DB0D|nr:site-specific integrase [Bradyrhizobium ivorense]